MIEKNELQAIERQERQMLVQALKNMEKVLGRKIS